MFDRLRKIFEAGDRRRMSGPKDSGQRRRKGEGGYTPVGQTGGTKFTELTPKLRAIIGSLSPDEEDKDKRDSRKKKTPVRPTIDKLL